MVKKQKLSLFLFLGSAIIAIILLSTGLSELDFQRGKSLNLLGLLLQRIQSASFASPTGMDADGTPDELLGLIFWVMLIFSLIYAFVSPRLRRQLLRTVLTLLFVIFALNLLAERMRRDEGFLAQRTSSGASGAGELNIPEPPPFVADPPNWFLILANLLLVLLLLGALLLLWRFLRSRADPQTLLVQEAAMALTDLEAGGDLKNVVLRCYVRMSQVLRKRQNIQRGEAMTPREFELHLAQVGLRDEHIRRLTRLFERVRYGAKPTGAGTEREAINCLTAIVETYGKS